MTVQLTAILDLTEQVQAAIDGGDWQRARELEGARRDAIVQLVAERAGDASLPGALADLYARNQRMLGRRRSRAAPAAARQRARDESTGRRRGVRGRALEPQYQRKAYSLVRLYP